MTVGEQRLAGTNRQVERAKRSDHMCMVGSQESIVRSLVAGIRETGGADTQLLTPGIGRLEIEAGDIPERCQPLQGVVVGMRTIGEKRRGTGGSASDGTAELRIRQDEI